MMKLRAMTVAQTSAIREHGVHKFHPLAIVFIPWFSMSFLYHLAAYSYSRQIWHVIA